MPARSPRRNLALELGLILLGLLLSRFGRTRAPRLPGVDAEDLAAGHETSDMSMAAVLGFAAGLLGALALIFVAVSWLEVGVSGLPFRLGAPGGVESQPSVTLPPEPRLQSEPGQEQRELRTRQAAQLEGYGWIDRGAGRVRIPIERAMDLLARRGLPSRPASEAAPFQDQAATSPSGASSGRVPEGSPR